MPLSISDSSEKVDHYGRMGLEERGAIFTRREVVEFILDLSGYTLDQPLHRFRLLEPSFGEGDFLVPVVERLVTSYQTSSDRANLVKNLSDAIRAIEIHAESIIGTRAKLLNVLQEHGVSEGDAQQLLTQIKRESSGFFERLVVDLLVKMGYGGSRQEAGKVVGRGGDEGIDGVINEDRLGLDVIYIQAKKWEGSVGRPEIQKFVGALHGQRAKKGVLITTSTFSSGGREYVKTIDPKVVLIDGEQLAHLMIDFDLGVSPVAQYHVKRLDADYFEDV